MSGGLRLCFSAKLGNHPLVAPSVHIRALQKAVEISGGREALAEHLGVKVAEIEKWLSAKIEIPRETFLRIVDIIIDELAGGDSEPGEPPSPRFSASSPYRDCD